MAHDVFISYATEDKPAADALCARLEQHGIRCWIAPRDILPGRDWRGSIVEAIASSRALVLMLSAKANTSTQIPKEILQATQKSLPIVTFRIENVAPSGPLSYELNSIHWLDAVTRPLERHIDALAGTLQKLLGVESPPVRPQLPIAPPVRGVSRSVLGYATITVVAAVIAVGWWVRSPTPTSPAQTIEQPAPVPPPKDTIQEQAVEPPKPVEASDRPSTSAAKTPAPAPPLEAKPEPSPVTTTSSATNAQRTEPAPAKATQAVARREDVVPLPSSRPTDPLASPPGSANSSRIVGCWRLDANPGFLDIRQDGTFISGGVVQGTWSASNDANLIYAFNFPDEVAFGEVSEDGKRLINPNAPGVPWIRVSPDPGIVGVWRLSSITLTIDADGTARMGPTLEGRWALADKARRSYMFTWPVKAIVTGSPDGNSIRYVDPQRGLNLTLGRQNCM